MKNRSGKNILVVSFLITAACLSLAPFLLMIFTSFKTQGTLIRSIRKIPVADFIKSDYLNLIGGSIYTVKTGSAQIETAYIEGIDHLGGPHMRIGYNNGQGGASFLVFTISQDIRKFRSVDFRIKMSGSGEGLFLYFDGLHGGKIRLPLEKYVNDAIDKWQAVSIPFEGINISRLGKGVSEKMVENLRFGFEADGPGEIFIDEIIFQLKTYTLQNFKDVLIDQKFGRYFLNSIIIAICVTLGNVFFSGMVGYTFARKSFAGKNILFLLIMASMMIPPQVFMVPMFILMKNLGWLNTYLALIVPALVAPFNIFLMRQYISKIPSSIEDIARIDGATEFQIYFKIIVPMSKPALTLVGINTFMGAWNTFLYPFLLTNTPEIRTLPVGLALYKSIHGVDWAHLMAGSTLTALPIAIVFLFFQKYIIAGITPERTIQPTEVFGNLRKILNMHRTKTM